MELASSLSSLRQATIDGLEHVRALSTDVEGFAGEAHRIQNELAQEADHLHQSFSTLVTTVEALRSSCHERIGRCETAIARTHAAQAALCDTLTASRTRLEESLASAVSTRTHLAARIGAVTRELAADTARHDALITRERERVAQCRRALDDRLAQARAALTALARTVDDASACDAGCVREVTHVVERGADAVRRAGAAIEDSAAAAGMRFEHVVRDEICNTAIGARAARLAALIETSLSERVEIPMRQMADAFVTRGIRAVAETAETSHADTLPTRMHLTEKTIALRDGPNLRRHLLVAADHLRLLGDLDPAGHLARLL